MTKYKSFFELMKNRQSCRNFDSTKKVSRELLVSIVETAKLSPSACNSQPYEIFIAQDESAQKVIDSKVENFNNFIDECGSFLIITESPYTLPSKMSSLTNEGDFRSIDIGILTANIVNAALDKGLETCILCVFDEKKLQKLVDREDRIKVVIAVGYPRDSYKIMEKRRKEFDENVHFI